MSIVSDAGPILSFARANRLDLLRQVVGALIIPEAVYVDIVDQGAGKPGSIEVHAAAWITREGVKDRSFVDQLPPHLHLGEREAIALAKEHGASLLVDERAARRTASQLNIPIAESLRVLKEAKDRGIISQVKPSLTESISTGTCVSDTLYHAFPHEAGES